MDIRIGHVEFDALASPVYVGFCEFDCSGPLESASVIGGKRKTSPVASPSRYHGRHDEADARALAAELDDEETVLVLLMEIACNVV